MSNTNGPISATIGAKPVEKIQEMALTGSALPLSIMFVSGITLCISAGQISSAAQNWGYTIAAGVVSSVFALGGLVMFRYQELYTKLLFTAPVMGEVTMGLLLNIFLFVWWSVAAGVITFMNPFTDTSLANGYLSTWVGFGASVVGLGTTGSKMIKTAASPLIAFGAASVILICATPGRLDKNNIHYAPDKIGETIFALVVACITLVMVLAFILLDGASGPSASRSRLYFYLLSFFSVVWFVMACVVTFSGPFKDIENGYLGAWAGVFASFFAADAALKHANGDSECGVVQATGPVVASADAV